MTARQSPWASEGSVEVSDDLTLHFQTAGRSSTAVIFVPGWTMTTEVFEHQFRHARQTSGPLA